MTLFKALVVSTFALLPLAPAATIFSDNFDAAPPGLNATPPGWSIFNTGGAVDTLNQGDFGLPCLGGAGRCLDLDGSTSVGGLLITSSSWNLTAGVTYNLTYYLAGSQRGDSNTVRVAIGQPGAVSASQSHTLPSGDGYTQFTLTFTPLANLTNQAIFFDQSSSADQRGLLLDNVAFADGDVPEPATALLLAGALPLLWYRLRRLRA